MRALVLSAPLFVLVSGMLVAFFAWRFAARRRSSVPPPPACSFPSVTIIVPVLDEMPLIDAKLTNLFEMRYPSDRLKILLVDGGSTDGTLERIARRIEDKTNVRLIRTDVRNKTAQVDAAVRESLSPWILMTDADALLVPDTLERATAAIAVQPGLGVVGVPVRPHAAHPLERLHWRLADWLRARELDCGTASIVTAPCYFARRELLANLPPDTVADDVHVACRAMRDGWRVGLVGARATEMRAPRTLGALFRHKFRKADAYLREIFRFLPDVGQMRPPMRSVFLWRVFLLTVFPPLAVLAAGQALWLLVALLAGDVATVALTAGVAPLLSIPLLFGRSREVALVVALGCVLVMVSALALLFYPISTQTASLGKILQPPDCRFSEGLE